jgi:hypothetical protein
MTHFLDHRTRSPLCRSANRVRWTWTFALPFVTCPRCREQILSLGARTAEEIAAALERLAGAPAKGTT